MITLLFLCKVIFLLLPSFVLAIAQQDNELTWIDEWVMKNPKFQAPVSSEFVLPGRYLIELAPTSGSTSSSFSTSSFSPLSYFQLVHEQAFENYQSSANDDDDDLPTTRMNLSVQHTYDNPAIFLGASIDFHLNYYVQADEDDNESFEKLTLATSSKVIATYHKVLDDFFMHQAIDKIYPVTIIPRPNPASQSNLLRKSLVNITQQLPTDLGALGFPFNLAQAQIDQTHHAGFLGQGMLVGIVDSGVDYYHPALGGGFGPEYTVTKGYDLVGNHFNMKNMSSREEHPTPLDNCAESGLGDSGHGTHVSGIIAADDKRYNFTGVAPKAKLGMWRVFSCNGSTSSDLVIKGLISAYEAGCDIINLSLGGPNNWEEDASAMIANRIANAGVPVSIAAGNDGAQGAFYISSPSTGSHAISVASINNNVTLQMTMEANINQSKESFGYELSSSTTTFPNGTLTSYNSQNEDNELACEGSTPNYPLENQIVLVRRGNCTYNEKSRVVAKAGGIGVLIYDPAHEMAYPPTTVAGEAPIPVAAISNEAGFFLRDAIIEKNGTIPVVFNTDLSPQLVTTGGLVSEFSSVGPTNEISLKPNMAGVGGYVFSTLPVALGGYGVLSGTSMASPFVAGCVSLFLQSQRQADSTSKVSQSNTASIDVTKVMELFANYAKPAYADPNSLIDEDDAVNITDVLDNPVKQGAGLIQVFDTINYSIHVSPSQISFNDTKHRKPHDLTISNLGHQTMTVQVVNQDPSVSVVSYNTSLQGYAPLEPAKTGLVKAKLSLIPKNVTDINGIYKQTWVLAPGDSISIEVRVASIDYGEGDGLDDPIGMFSASTNNTDLPYPIFGGYLNIKATPTKTNEDAGANNTSVILVPYFGIQGNVQELPIFDAGFPKLAFKPLLRNSRHKKKHPRSLGLNKRIDAFNADSNSIALNDTGPPITSMALPTATKDMSIIVRLLTGTAMLATEVWEYDSTLGRRTKFVGYAMVHAYLPRNTLTDRPYTVFPWKRTVLAHPPTLPGHLKPWYNYSDKITNDTLAASTAAAAKATKVKRVPPGDYVLHWRALKLLAEPSLPTSWESVTSEPFRITR